MDVVVVRTRSPADLPAAVAALRGVHVADGYPMRWPHDPADWLTPGPPHRRLGGRAGGR